MDSADIERAISDLEVQIDRLRALYEQYFLGMEKLEPLIPRKNAERLLQALRRERLNNTAQRFRFQQIVQRYNTLQTYWRRVSRQIEEGTYRRDVMRARERAKRKEKKLQTPDEPQKKDTVWTSDIDEDELTATLETNLDALFDQALVGVPSSSSSPALPSRPATANGSQERAEKGIIEDRPPQSVRQRAAASRKPPSAPARTAEDNASPTEPAPPPPAAAQFQPAAPQPPTNAGPAPGPAGSPRPPEPHGGTLPRPRAAPGAKHAARPPSGPGARGGAAAPRGRGGEGLSEGRISNIYKDYLSARESCNQNVRGMTREKVERQLRQQEAALKRKHGGSIDFQVEVRNGKAVLRAVRARK